MRAEVGQRHHIELRFKLMGLADLQRQAWYAQLSFHFLCENSLICAEPVDGNHRSGANGDGRFHGFADVHRKLPADRQECNVNLSQLSHLGDEVRISGVVQPPALHRDQVSNALAFAILLMR